MDKKQELTPELKSIYERVMNTATPKPSQPTPAPQAPATPPAQAAAPATPTTPPAAPVRPIASTQGFAFSASGGTTPVGTTAPPSSGKKMGIPKPVLYGLVGLFVAVWGVFWAKVLGYF